MGALNGAVMPVPESSGCAGHPLFAHNAAISATIVGSVTRRASPETITSKPFVATLIVQRGSRATFFALRVRSPVWNQHEPACQSAPTLVTCGLPSAFGVVGNDSTPSRPPTGSTAAATWTSRWVSTPPTIGRVTSTMDICHPFLCNWVQGVARTSREGDRDELAVGAAGPLTLRYGACLIGAGDRSHTHQQPGGSHTCWPSPSLTGQSACAAFEWRSRRMGLSACSPPSRHLSRTLSHFPCRLDAGRGANWAARGR